MRNLKCRNHADSIRQDDFGQSYRWRTVCEAACCDLTRDAAADMAASAERMVVMEDGLDQHELQHQADSRDDQHHSMAARGLWQKIAQCDICPASTHVKTFCTTYTSQTFK